MYPRLLATAAAATMSLSVLAAPALADMVTYAVELTGAEEVPPLELAGKGKVDATLDTDTKKLTWTVTYEGLSGPVTAAHFHGPADKGANAPPVVPVSGDLASGFKGETTLTDAQMTELQDGKWYFNIHTAANPGGEIRGQLVQEAM